MAPDVWAADWGAHFARLHSLRTEHYTDAQWQQALADLTDVDRTTVDRLLNGDLDA